MAPSDSSESPPTTLSFAIAVRAHPHAFAEARCPPCFGILPRATHPPSATTSAACRLAWHDCHRDCVCRVFSASTSSHPLRRSKVCFHLLRLPFAESKPVSVYANSPKRDPRRARARRSARLLPRMRRPRRFLLEGQAGETMDDDADAWMNTSFGTRKEIARSDADSCSKPNRSLVNTSYGERKRNGRVNRHVPARSPATEVAARTALPI